MQALFRVLMLVFLITGLALSAAWAGDQQFSPPLPPGITPQWVPIPGAPGVHYAPNTNTDLFRYGQKYYFQHDAKWYQGRNLAGQALDYGARRTGWGEESIPPGQMKKYEEGQHMPPGQMKKSDR